MTDEQHKDEFKYYQATHSAAMQDYSRRNPDQMARDLNVAHDFIRKLVKEKDQINRNLGAALRKVGFQKIWIGVLTAAVIGLWAIVGWMVNALLSR